MRAWKLLPIRLPARSGIYAMGSKGDIVYVSPVNGKHATVSAQGKVLTQYRMEGYTVIRTVRSRNHSPINHTANPLLRTSASLTTAEVLSHSAKQFYLATKPC